MQTRISSKGQVVIPEPVRRRLGIGAGDALEVEVNGQRIILKCKKHRRPVAKIVKDPITGFPVMRVEGAPVLTSQEVEDALAGFP